MFCPKDKFANRRVSLSNDMSTKIINVNSSSTSASACVISNESDNLEELFFKMMCLLYMKGFYAKFFALFLLFSLSLNLAYISDIHQSEY